MAWRKHFDAEMVEFKKKKKDSEGDKMSGKQVN